MNNHQESPKDAENLSEEVMSFFKVIRLAEEIRSKRGNPLLLMFYSEAGEIKLQDTVYMEKILAGKKFRELDLIIHTRGGDVSGSYFLAQLIRNHCEKLNVIIPFYSYSGGTVISLAADTVHMGACSRLSPIDVQMSAGPENSVSLINFDKVVEFIKETSESFEFQNEANRASMATSLLLKVMENIHPLQMGELHRLRTLHWYYAKKLLTSYMFQHDTDKDSIADDIVDKLTSDVPTHTFDIDRNIARDIGIKVTDAEDEIYKLGRQLIEACISSKKKGMICKFISEEKRMPYFQIWCGEPNER